MSAPDSARPPAGVARAAGGTCSKGSGEDPLLLVVDPVARLTDAESVRIARDVLRAATPGLKLCLPDDPAQTPRLLARCGSRRPVLVGDDRALLHAVRYLHGERALGGTALSVVPVGDGPSVALARSLGLPLDAVSAARTVLRGNPHAMDLLVDDEDGVVLGGVRTEASPAVRPPRREEHAERDADRAGQLAGQWRRMYQALARTMLAHGRGRASGERGGLSPAAAGRPVPSSPPASRRPPARGAQRLRVEADGAVVAGPDRPVTDVTVRTTGTGGLAEVSVQPLAGTPLRVRAHTVTVSAPDGFPGFRYRADADADSGAPAAPAASRTWTVLPRAWHLVLPAG
ncbi:hypothetical protein [Streptomyces qinglanensis]|uniref:hypothetical protein n=1 Tax=Streptomyces qinglanensis TaxID=943816 RepID=UPI00378CCD10